MNRSISEEEDKQPNQSYVLRQMGRVPLLTREQEVSIAKRIENGQIRSNRVISRSPIAIAELVKIGDELETGTLSIRDVVAFSEQAEIDEQEDRGDEYLRLTMEGVQRIRALSRQGQKEWEKVRAEMKVTRGKKSKKFLRLKRKAVRARLDIAREIKELNLKEDTRQRLIRAIGVVYKEVRSLEREIEKLTEKLNRKRIKPDDEKEYKRQISADKRRLKQIEAETYLSPIEIKRSHQAIAVSEAQTTSQARDDEANLRLVVSIAKK